MFRAVFGICCWQELTRCVPWRPQINLQAGSQNLTIGNRVLTVGQFHWHASSEHTVDNSHHAMELHFVLTYVDTGERSVHAVASHPQLQCIGRCCCTSKPHT